MMKKTVPLLLTGLAGSLAAQTSLTIYNDNFAKVSEELTLPLVAGRTTFAFDGATAQVTPDSVVLSAKDEAVKFSILEQSYRNDPVTEGLMLERFVGQTIPFETVLADGSARRVMGKVVRSGYVPSGQGQTPIIEVDEELIFRLPGSPVFPALGDDSILKPTLSWELQAEEEGNVAGQLAYLTGGLSWEATYNLVVAEGGKSLELQGWVTLINRSGTAFDDATVKLIAGEVNRVDLGLLPPLSSPMAAGSAVREVVESRAFGDYYLYSLPRPLNLRDQEMKQVGFLTAADVAATKSYRFESPSARVSRGSWSPTSESSIDGQVTAFWTFENVEANGLGVALPAGTIRIYEMDRVDGNLEFVGEDNIYHTPQKEVVEVKVGDAFDISGEWRVVDFQASEKDEWARESVEIELTNRSEKAVTVAVGENLWRSSNVVIEAKSHEFTRPNVSRLEFEVEVPADGQTTVKYRARYSAEPEE